ncbi:MAG TPA: HAD-IA family hydrolase [Trueperaceae bacterium]
MSEPLERAPVIVFDLDGTLVDSLTDIVVSFRQAFGELGLDQPEEEAVKALIGRPLDEMYARFAPAARVAALSASYRRHYPKNFTRNSRIFPGVADVLTELRRRGNRLAVATTKRTEMALALVEATGIASYLDHVQGTDDFPHKPAPDVVLRAAAAVGGSPAWMVGDTTADIEAGRAAGAATYAVTWGTHDEATLAGARPDLLEPDLSRLLEVTRTAIR